MKKILILPCLLIALAIQSQPKPKSNKPPSSKELADMMKEMEAAMKEMSPEDKRMLDSMGVKLPSSKKVQEMAAFAAANPNAANEVLVPKRDAARIASISKVPLTDATLPTYM